MKAAPAPAPAPEVQEKQEVPEEKEQEPEENEEEKMDVKEVKEVKEEEEEAPSAAKVSQDASSPKSSDAEQEAESEKAKGVWIIRIPRVDVDTTKLKTLEAELQGLNKQVIALNAIIRVKRVEKEGAFQRTNAAREKLKVSSAASREKIEELAPYREKVKLQQEQVRNMKDIGRDLQCKTEEELLRKLEGMELTIAHGSLTLNEEKEMVKKIKKLKMQKDSIKEYDTNKEAIAETKLEIDEFKDYLKVLNSELDILKFRENGNREVFLRHKEEEEKIQESLGGLIKERNELKASSDECYGRVKKERARCRKLIAEFSKSRQTKAGVKKLIESSQYDEAVTLAKNSVESWFQEKWNADKSYREKYVANMTKHRHKKTSIEEVESELNSSFSSSKKAKERAPRKPIEKPEDVVAALLKQANQEWIESKKPKVPVVVEVEAASDKKPVDEEKDRREPAAEKDLPKAKPQKLQKAAARAVPVAAEEVKKPKPFVKPAAHTLEIDETIVAGFELPSVVKEIISDAQKASEPVKYYSHQEKTQKKPRKSRKARRKIELKEEEKKQGGSPSKVAPPKPQAEQAPSPPQEEPPRSEACQEDKPAAATSSEAKAASEKKMSKQKQLRRVKKNGKIVFIPSDQKIEKPMVSSAMLSYAVPALVGVATVVGSIAGSIIYARS